MRSWAPGHSRTTSLDLRHSRNSSADLNKFIRNDVSLVFSPNQGNFLRFLLDFLKFQ